MNQDGIARKLAKEFNISVALADKYVAAIRRIIIEGIAEDGKVLLVGLGTFTKRKRKAKKVHGIPGVFDDVVKPEYFSAHFHPGKDLCDRLNEVK